MNKSEALKIIKEELNSFRIMNFSDLREMIGATPFTKEVFTETGNKYQIEIIAVWDSKPLGDIRVIGNIDDGGLRSLFPLSRNIIISESENN